MDHRCTPTASPVFLTARSAAARLGVDERTIRRAIARGDLHAVKRAGAFQISPTDLDRFSSYRSRPPGAAGGDPGVGPEATPPGQEAFSRGDQLPGQPLPVRGSLPVPLTSLVGREREIAALVTALRGRDRLLTLTGPGGVGKTRLALAAASAVAGDTPGGVCYVALGAIGDPRLVAQTIAHALGVREAGGESIEVRLTSALRDQRLLLVLDNFEQVIEAAPLVADLLAACQHLQVLVTSRVRLRISGERERQALPLRVGGRRSEVEPKTARRQDGKTASFPVLRPPSSVPSPVTYHPSPAVELFVERARAVRGDIVFTAEQAAAVEAICQRLDGLPLAIELAAVRVNVLSPKDVLAHLERLLPLLTGGPRDAPARLRTMRDAIAWSYDLLTTDEQDLFRRLAVFTGGFTLDAAEGVSDEGDGVRGSWGDRGTNDPSPYDPITPSPSVLDLVAALVEKSLLRVDVVAGGAARYGMLETIREFGLERLAASGEADAVRQRHAAWCLAFAEDAGPRAKQSGAAVWFPRLEAEHPNLRAALGWYLGQGDGPRLLRMAASLWPFWQEHSHAGEGLRWLELALDFGQHAPASDRLRALAGAGTLPGT